MPGHVVIDRERTQDSIPTAGTEAYRALYVATLAWEALKEGIDIFKLIVWTMCSFNPNSFCKALKIQIPHTGSECRNGYSTGRWYARLVPSPNVDPTVGVRFSAIAGRFIIDTGMCTQTRDWAIMLRLRMKSSAVRSSRPNLMTGADEPCRVPL